ncbi:mycothione reductase [Streptomyces nymphaeiformis]|uniref:Mycothione reductase n=1 Tax=Streptomyces nymphaeiformis TaxID=2663842 RepID=A0A7W7U9F3_9ACTN|nr:mycothione reductase [Streptomyces nymphaeiformis]MBB4986667.1 mycothione reductase [Streptomyces nymphaeiformis]
MEQHFDLVIIGSGSGNSIVDERFADWKVAFVEKGIGPLDSYGGTCLNVGCIPTKMFVHTADTARAPEHGAALGVDLALRGVDWPVVRDRVFGRIDPIAQGGERYRASGHDKVTLYRGTARFIGERRLTVATAEGPITLTADRIVVATGSRPVVPDVPGLDESLGFHTSDSVMRLEALPRRMTVLGSGFVATELAHVFSSLGVEITLIARGDLLLRHEDADVARRFTELAQDQWDVRLNRKLVGADRSPDGTLRLDLEGPQGAESVDTDELLVAVGRRPNSDLVDAAAGGLDLHADGRITVDAHQATSVPGVWALGDVSSPWQLKHVANHEARVVQHNLLHPDALRATDHRHVPHAVFSSPKIAAVGLTEQEAQASGRPYVTAMREYSGIAYGWAMEDATGFAKVLADPATGEILGAHIIGPEAPTLIQPLVQAMAFGLDARAMATGQYWIHPAMPELIENALLALPLD